MIQFKGFFGARSRLFTVAAEAVDHALLHSYKDRKLKKRNFRALWIVRINAAARAAGLTYGQMINGMKKANMGLNRKSIADMAYHDPKSFNALAEKVKETLAA